MHRTFWTERRFIGLFLIVGSLTFLAGAGMPVQDSSGEYVYTLSMRDGLLAIYHHQALWTLANGLFISGTIITLFGWGGLSLVLRERGYRLLAQAALALLTLAASLLVIDMTFHLSVDFPVAQNLVKTGVIAQDYVWVSGWTDALFTIYSVLILLSMLAFGATLVLTRLLPVWLGWTMVGYNLIFLILVVLTGDLPPFVHQLLPIVLGVLLLLPRYQTATASQTAGVTPHLGG